MDKEILRLEKVNKSFGGVHAVKDISMTIAKGELTAIIGPNGAGKTTIFNLISGVYKVSSGDIFFNSKSLLRFRPDQIVGMGISRTFQNLRLFNDASVLENVMTAMQQQQKYSFFEAVSHLGRWKNKEKATKERSMELLDRVGLADRYMQEAGTLPYGLQRRLEMARAIALEPELLLLDEPAAGMNAEESLELVSFVKEIKEKFKITILMIEHHMDVVTNLCDYCTVLNFGKTIAVGTPAEVKSNPDVIKAYLGGTD